MALAIDLASARRSISEDAFQVWAHQQTVFLSSVMGELTEERKALAHALVEDGFAVRWFEDFGGRDDSAATAYLTEVAQSDIYLGLLGDEYGPMQASHFSATHEEYSEARSRGKRVTFWARRDDRGRDGHAVGFLNEVRVFQVTGGFDGVDDLVSGVRARLREMAGEDLAPWVKLGDTVFRATSVSEEAQRLTVEGEIRDSSILAAIRDLEPDNWSRGTEVSVATSDRAGRGRVESIRVRSESTAVRNVTVEAAVEWAAGGDSMAMSTAGYSAEELVEVSVRTGLLREPLPERLSGRLTSSMVDTADPFEELQRQRIPEGSIQPIARLFVVESLVGTRRASRIENFALGPERAGRRQVQLGWRDATRFSNVTPQQRSVEGDRPWG